MHAILLIGYRNTSHLNEILNGPSASCSLAPPGGNVCSDVNYLSSVSGWGLQNYHGDSRNIYMIWCYLPDWEDWPGSIVQIQEICLCLPASWDRDFLSTTSPTPHKVMGTLWPPLSLASPLGSTLETSPPHSHLKASLTWSCWVRHILQKIWGVFREIRDLQCRTGLYFLEFTSDTTVPAVYWAVLTIGNFLLDVSFYKSLLPTKGSQYLLSLSLSLS